MNIKRLILLSAGCLAIAIADPASARSIRVDSGEWTEIGTFNTDSSQSLGFSFAALGVSTSTASVGANGSLSLFGGESLSLFPFLETDQGADGGYVVDVTNAAFSAAGIDAGFRVTWSWLDSAGALTNQFQASIFDLTNDLFAIEFNYNQILRGDDDSRIGFDSSQEGPFDLASFTGLTFADYSGVGNDEFSPDNCLATPDALACNNFYFNTGVYGPAASVLPDIANSFFRRIDSNSDADDAQGRHLYVFDADAVQVPEPSSLQLISLGLLAFGFVGHRRRAYSRSTV